MSAKTLPNVAPSGNAAEAIEKYGRGTAVTQAFMLKQAAPDQVEKFIKPFLTEPGANSIALPQLKALIITDYATNIPRIARWIELLDQPRPEAVFEFVTIQHVPVGTLAGQVSAILGLQGETGRRGESGLPARTGGGPSH